MFLAAARLRCSSVMISASSLRFRISGWSCCFPLSARARVRSWEIRLDILRAWFVMARMQPLVSSGVVSSREAYSHWERMTATGVRSSWETSEVNCFSFSKEAWSLSIIRSKVWAILWTSSFPSPTLILWERSFPSLICRAVSVMSARGARVLRMIR